MKKRQYIDFKMDLSSYFYDKNFVFFSELC